MFDSTDNIVAMDVEYGGGRTVPRIAVVNFNEECIYYSDFCLRYEDWIQTKITEITEEQQLQQEKENPVYYSTVDPPPIDPIEKVDEDVNKEKDDFAKEEAKEDDSQ